MWVDQERVESMCTPSNLYVATLSTVCDAILANMSRLNLPHGSDN